MGKLNRLKIWTVNVKRNFQKIKSLINGIECTQISSQNVKKKRKAII